MDVVPAIWDRVWEGPDSALDYIRAAAAKSAAVLTWHDRALSQGLLTGAPLDLADLFNPVAFLNALKQETARELGTSMDSLILVTCWDQGLLTRAGAKKPIAVGNLFISGATFDGRSLGGVAPDSATFLPVPAAFLAWIPKDLEHPYGAVGHMEVPLYMDRSRSRVLAAAQVPVSDPANERKRWILSSVALFLST